MKSSVRFGIAFGSILVFGLLVNFWARLGEAETSRRQLSEFPQKMGTWSQSGIDTQLDEPTMKVLRASDYLLRDYRRSDGIKANLYVGYYASQRNGATYHSPLNCLPGSGWNMSEPGRISVSRADGSSFEANRYVIQNGSQRAAMVYWYQGRGRAIASEYWGKVYTVIDSVRLRRSDAAMVRITVPVAVSEEAAFAAAQELATLATGHLGDYVPN